MKTLSPLASQVLTMIEAPAKIPALVKAFGGAFTGEAIEAALDELLAARLVTCDEHEGVPYFYRRDTEAERARAAKWNDAQRAAEKARDAAIHAAQAAYIAAMDAADAERDAADPMAQIKARVAA